MNSIKFNLPIGNVITSWEIFFKKVWFWCPRSLRSQRHFQLIALFSNALEQTNFTFTLSIDSQLKTNLFFELFYGIYTVLACAHGSLFRRIDTFCRSA